MISLLTKLLFLIFFISLTQAEFPSDSAGNNPLEVPIVVNASELGLIRGYPGWTFTGTKFWMFHGIPYAFSPGGDDRFKPSRLKDIELSATPGGIFNAYNPLIMCPQSNLIGLMNSDQGDNNVDVLELFQAERRVKMNKRLNKKDGLNTPKAWGTEDCLVLNIFTKNINQNSSIVEPAVPVLFYIHGGSSDSAWGGPFGGLRLLDEPIVLVSINYRLGILGSLNLGISDAPGNAAMYDCVTALRWVNKYISHFGGDPNRVIIAGHSAGSMMVTHLLLSPLAKNLFHGVIGMSGSSLSSWATATHPSIHHYLKVSKYSGCYNGSVELDEIDLDEAELNEILACLKRESTQTLIDAVDRHSAEQQLEGTGMGYDDKVPSIQSPNLTGIEIFLSKSPFEIVENGEQADVPLMMGAMRHDGTMALEKTYYDYLVPNNLVTDSSFLINELVPKLCNLMGTKDQTEALYHSMGQTYMGKEKNSGNFTAMLPGLIDMHSVFAFKTGAYNLIEKHAKLNKDSYYFSFDYDGLFSIYDPNSDIPGGIAHVDDILYLFFGGIMISPADRAVANRYVKYWINFIYNGNPNLPEDIGINEWPPYSSINHPFRSIRRFDTTEYWTRDSFIGPGYEIVPGDETVTSPTTTNEQDGSTPALVESTTADNVEPTTNFAHGLSINFEKLFFTYLFSSLLTLLLI